MGLARTRRVNPQTVVDLTTKPDVDLGSYSEGGCGSFRRPRALSCFSPISAFYRLFIRRRFFARRRSESRACRYTESKYANTLCREENKPEATRRITSVHSRVAQKNGRDGNSTKKGDFCAPPLLLDGRVLQTRKSSPCSERSESWRIPRAKKASRAKRRSFPPPAGKKKTENPASKSIFCRWLEIMLSLRPK